MFWWWTAVALALRPDLSYVLSLYLRPAEPSMPPYLQCVDFDAPPPAEWRLFLQDLASELATGMSLASIGALVFLALTVRRFGPGRPEVHARAARWGFAVVTLPDLLSALMTALLPAQLDQECLARLDLPGEDYVSIALAWIVSANVAVLVAGAVGTRTRPGRALLVGGLQVVTSLPERHTGPALTADGTPRHALLSSYGRNKPWSDGSSSLYVLDLTQGKTVDWVDLPADGRFAEYTAVARDREPGHYVVAASTPSSADFWSPRGRTSRIFQLTMDDRGRARLDEAISADLEGVVTALAVSPEGRLAYGRTVTDGQDAYSSFVGVLGSGREWPAETPNGLSWTNPTTLVLPHATRSDNRVERTAAGPRIRRGRDWKVTLDVGSGATGRFPIPRTVGGHVLLTLPDGRTVMADNYHENPRVRPKVVVYEGDTIMGSVYTASRGVIVSLTLDRTGEHLIVGQDNQNDPYDMPKDDYELVRVGLRPLAGVPAPARSTRRDLRLPRQVVWRGAQPVVTLGW